MLGVSESGLSVQADSGLGKFESIRTDHIDSGVPVLMVCEACKACNKDTELMYLAELFIRSINTDTVLA